jgi:hypothetical protein
MPCIAKILSRKALITKAKKRLNINIQCLSPGQAPPGREL